ncbi:hypothetical protein Tcan_07951 [Toxocara canis]|uniref:Uncharacterized protein n=1 Tax=Toxocara canis TaxID=6265 RepID=A0A0B2V9L9_TOXCA|nr:hypothetical protein Tcan_07951 [Toxocara canis]
MGYQLAIDETWLDILLEQLGVPTRYSLHSLTVLRDCPRLKISYSGEIACRGGTRESEVREERKDRAALTYAP